MIEKLLLEIDSPPTRCVAKISGTTKQVYFEFEANLHALEATRTGAPRVFLTIDSAARTVRRLFPHLDSLTIAFEHAGQCFKQEVTERCGPAVCSSLEHAPAAMSVKYVLDPTMFGYKSGGYVGALVMAIPVKTEALSSSHASQIPVFAFGRALVLEGLKFVIGIVIPANQLARFAKQVVASDPSSPSEEFQFVANVDESKNELHEINDALNTLQRSQSLAGQGAVSRSSFTSDKSVNLSRGDSTLGSTELGFEIY